MIPLRLPRHEPPRDQGQPQEQDPLFLLIRKRFHLHDLKREQKPLPLFLRPSQGQEGRLLVFQRQAIILRLQGFPLHPGNGRRHCHHPGQDQARHRRNQRHPFCIGKRQGRLPTGQLVRHIGQRYFRRLLPQKHPIHTFYGPGYYWLQVETGRDVHPDK